MPAIGVALLAALLASAALLARPRHALLVTFATFVLLPGTLVVPNGVTGLPTVHRVVLLGLFVGLVWRTTTGRLDPGIWRPTRVHLGLALLLAVAYVCGVLLAPTETPWGPALFGWVALVDLALTFVVMLAAIRATADPRWVLGCIAGVLTASVAVALVEHITGGSFGHWLFSHLPSQRSVDAANPLERRVGGEMRVRAGAGFALEFAWVCVALLPALLAATLRRSRGAIALALLGTAAVVAAVYWSYARSVLLGVVVGAVLFAAGIRTRRAVAFVGVGLLAGLAAYLLLPEMGHHFSAALDEGSIIVRTHRLPAVLGIAALHPLSGLGLGGLAPYHLGETDSSWVLTYATTGAIGLAAFAVAAVTAVIASARALLVTEPDTRALGAAGTAGALTLLLSAFAFDSFAVPGSSRVFWTLAAAGVAAADALPRPALSLRLPMSRLAWPVAGLAVGAAVWALAPVHQAMSLTVLTIPAGNEAGTGDPSTTGRQLLTTVCDVATGAARHARIRFDCRDSLDSPGMGTLRLEAASRQQLTEAGTSIYVAIRGAVPSVGVTADGPVTAGRSAPWRTAPASLAMAAAGAALLLPVRRRHDDPYPVAAPVPMGEPACA